MNSNAQWSHAALSKNTSSFNKRSHSFHTFASASMKKKSSQLLWPQQKQLHCHIRLLLTVPQHATLTVHHQHYGLFRDSKQPLQGLGSQMSWQWEAMALKLQHWFSGGGKTAGLHAYHVTILRGTVMQWKYNRLQRILHQEHLFIALFSYRSMKWNSLF